MKKFWNAHPLLKLLFPLMLGIAVSSFFQLQQADLLWALIILALIITLVSIFIRFRSSVKWWSGLFVSSSFFLFGFANYQLHQQQEAQFIPNYRAEKQPFAAQVLEEPLIKERSIAILSKIIEHPNPEIVGKKAMIYLARSRQDVIKQGDVILTNHFLNELNPPQNPFEFNYRRHMQKQGVLYQTYLSAKQQVNIISAPPAKQTFIERIRNTGFSFVKQHISQQNQGIAKALLFGHRDELSKETATEFAKAGTMHILAVSGLHVGIVFFLANWLLGLVNRVVKMPKWLTVSCLLLIIWVFVFLTGAKASVMRAGIMFTLFVIGLHFFPKNYTLNTLGIAAMILLAINPEFLFDVSFQLSFSAVVGILLIVPALQDLFLVPKYFIPKYLLDITYVSIAAQLATLPFVIYYFQQLPTLGLVTNLFAIPLAFGIVAVGFIGFLLSALPILPSLFGQLLDWLLSALQMLNSSVANLSFSTVQSLYITVFQALLLFFSVTVLALMFKSRNRKLFLFSLLGFTLFTASVAWQKWQVNNKNQFMVYTVNNNVVAQLQKGREVHLFAQSQITDEAFLYNIQPNLKGNYIQNKHFYTLSDSIHTSDFYFKDGLLLVDNEIINFNGKEETSSPASVLIVDRADYKTLAKLKNNDSKADIVIVNGYPNRTVSDSLAHFHFLQTEGYYHRDLTNF